MDNPTENELGSGLGLVLVCSNWSLHMKVAGDWRASKPFTDMGTLVAVGMGVMGWGVDSDLERDRWPHSPGKVAQALTALGDLGAEGTEEAVCF